jgi:hypothetical protein
MGKTLFGDLELDAMVGHPRPRRASEAMDGELASAETAHGHRQRHVGERLARQGRGEHEGFLPRAAS